MNGHAHEAPRGPVVTDGDPPAGQVRPVVLVVDDTDCVRVVLRAGLRRHGFEVWTAGDGREAVALYRGLVRRDRDAVALVLLDVQMPGLDGPGVLAALQAVGPKVRAFFMTGDPGRYSEAGLLALGARRVFPKPLNIAAVATELRRNLGAAGRGEVATAHPSS
jgi:two-component system response regulator PrrA